MFWMYRMFSSKIRAPIFNAVGYQNLKIYNVLRVRQITFYTKLNQEAKSKSESSNEKGSKQERRQSEKKTQFEENIEKNLMIQGSFEQLQHKNKDTYLDMIKVFQNRTDNRRRNHVEFIYAALKNMSKFGVNKDLVVYKALIDVMPKGKFIPQNAMQVEFQHYPKQQQCMIDLLEQMEDNGVMVSMGVLINYEDSLS